MAQAREAYQKDKKVNAFVKAGLALWGTAQECADHQEAFTDDEGNPSSVTLNLCKISDDAIVLIQAASRKAKELAALMKPINDKTSKYIYDTRAAKKVVYQKRSRTINGRKVVQVNNVELIGFIRDVEEGLENDLTTAPDAVSATTVKLAANNQGGMDVTLNKRVPDKVFDFKSDAENDSVQFIVE